MTLKKKARTSDSKKKESKTKTTTYRAKGGAEGSTIKKEQLKESKQHLKILTTYWKDTIFPRIIH